MLTIAETGPATSVILQEKTQTVQDRKGFQQNSLKRSPSAASALTEDTFPAGHEKL